MNNTCPTCGAVYAVAAKDIGRKIRCKKCSTALRVDDTGLVVDAPAPAVAAAVVADDFDADDAVVSPKGKKGAGRRYSGAGAGEFLRKIGGIPTLLFAFGVFLTIWFFFQQYLGAPEGPSNARAKAALEKLDLDKEQKIRKVRDEKDPEELSGEAMAEYLKNLEKETKRINKEMRKPYYDAGDDYKLTKIGNARSGKLDIYGLMFGFLFLSLGCIGYMRADTNLVLRIVAGAILTILLMAVFAKFSGCAR